MDQLARAVEAADGPWPVIAIGLIGLYVLAWKFGGELLSLLRENIQLTKAAHDETKQISESIVTNHGSKNLGDAIDKITEKLEGMDQRLQVLEENRS